MSLLSCYQHGSEVHVATLLWGVSRPFRYVRVASHGEESRPPVLRKGAKLVPTVRFQGRLRAQKEKSSPRFKRLSALEELPCILGCTYSVTHLGSALSSRVSRLFDLGAESLPLKRSSNFSEGNFLLAGDGTASKLQRYSASLGPVLSIPTVGILPGPVPQPIGRRVSPGNTICFNLRDRRWRHGTRKYLY